MEKFTAMYVSAIDVALAINVHRWVHFHIIQSLILYKWQYIRQHQSCLVQNQSFKDKTSLLISRIKSVY